MEKQENKLSYTTLKKEWSVSCKNYITLGLQHDGTYIIVEDSKKMLTYPVRSIETANEYFEYYVNKI